MMLMRNQLTIAEYVFKRVTGLWFWGLTLLACGLVYFLAGGDAANLRDRLNSREDVFLVIEGYVLLLVTVVAATEIPRDIASRVIYIILSKPVEKGQIVLGKFLGVLAIGIVSVILTSLTALATFSLNGVALDAYTWQSLALVLASILVFTSAAVFFSALFSEMTTIILTMVYLLYGNLALNIRVLGKFFGGGEDAPSKASEYLLEVLYFIAPNLRFLSSANLAAPIEMTSPLGQGSTTQVSINDYSTLPWENFVLAMAYAVVYSGMLVSLAMILFSRRRVA